MKIEYRIDEHDRVVYVGGDWTAFALANHGHALTPERVLGESIWSFIAGDEIAELYRQLFDRLRRSGGEAQFPFRCDAPHERRLLDMFIRSHAGGSLSLETVAREVVLRPRLSVFDVDSPRSQDLVRICAWCVRVYDGVSAWIEIEQAARVLELFQRDVPPQVTHGVCPECLAMIEAEYDE